MNQPHGYGPPPSWGHPQAYRPPPKQGMSGCAIAAIVVGIITFLGICGTLIFCVALVGSTSAPRADTKPPTAVTVAEKKADPVKAEAPKAAPEPPKPEPATKVTAKEIIDAYKENEVAADAKYKGKKFEITGTVLAIQSGIGDEPIVSIGTGGPYEIIGVSLNGLSKDTAAKLKKGSKITAVCDCAGEVISIPQMNDCTLQ